MKMKPESVEKNTKPKKAKKNVKKKGVQHPLE